jgi:hypothetical protein
MKPFWLFLTLTGLAVSCVREPARNSSRSAQESLAKEVLADTNSTLPAISLAIRDLSDAKVDASFWVALANDEAYPKSARSAFNYHLFRHYVHPGMTLNELANVIGAAKWKWIEPEKIIEIRNFSGSYPVRNSIEDIGYAIHSSAVNKPFDVTALYGIRKRYETERFASGIVWRDVCDKLTQDYQRRCGHASVWQ